eukprot:scaffold17324_cov45-Cyclotella_meneghiniana.AAC.1
MKGWLRCDCRNGPRSKAGENWWLISLWMSAEPLRRTTNYTSKAGENWWLISLWMSADPPRRSK